MTNPVERSLESALTPPFCFGELFVRKTTNGGFVVSHRDDESLDQLQTHQNAEDALGIAKYDDAGNYRPLKTAPNLRHGWRLDLATHEELRRSLDYFYPGRLAVFAAWQSAYLKTTPLRETLDRQSGMYRVAAKVSDQQINDLVADFCRSDSGCLRTILWKRDRSGVIPSMKLPKQKFDPSYDQVMAACSRRPASDARASRPPSFYSGVAGSEAATVPLLCQEACNLLVAECRKVVKGENAGL
jgi:DR2241 stabilising domain/4Fe-4S iron-sulfur cluster binding domain